MTADGFGYCCALVVAALFLLSGTAKLRNGAATEASFRELAVPSPKKLALAVPIAELTIAFLLVTIPSIGAIGALVMLGFFTTFLVRRLREGVAAPCGCLGEIDRQPLSIADVVRNVSLIVLAGAAVVATRPAVPTLLDVTAALGLVLVCIAAHSLTRQIGSPRPAVGEPAGTSPVDQPR